MANWSESSRQSAILLAMKKTSLGATSPGAPNWPPQSLASSDRLGEGRLQAPSKPAAAVSSPKAILFIGCLPLCRGTLQPNRYR